VDADAGDAPPVSKVIEECNWLQASKAVSIPSHAPILHRTISASTNKPASH